MSEYIYKTKGTGKIVDIWSSKTLCLCLIDKNGEPKAISAGTRRLLGIDNPGSPAPSIRKCVHPQDRDSFMNFIERLQMEDHEIPAHHFRLVSSDGQVIAVEIEGEKQKDGEESLLLLSMHELPVHAEHSALDGGDSESLMSAAESMIESVVEGSFIVDVSGRILMVNQALLEMLDVRRYKLIDMPVGVIFASDKQGIENATARFARILKYGKAKDIDMELIAGSGKKIPVSYSGSVIRSRKNELVGVLSVVKDMREDRLLKELEWKNIELENAYSELKSLDEMKDDLLSLVGHELRAPLSNILGYSEFLMEDDISRKETTEFSSIIYQESRRLTRLVNDILDLSRMERGKLVYNYLKANLNEVVRMSLKAVEGALREKGVYIETSLDERIPVMEFDPDRIQQVIVNILDNAIKFSEAGKTIRVESEAGEGQATISIADQGIGIAQEQAHKVFSKFEQIEDLRKHTRGSGLGMPIAKRIIEEGHSGKIWFESKGLGMGTTFLITLPETTRE